MNGTATLREEYIKGKEQEKIKKQKYNIIIIKHNKNNNRNKTMLKSIKN